MHNFPHGIWRAFLTACGGSLSTCLPLLPSDGVEPAEEEAVNSDLQPAYQEGHKEEKGASQPKANGADNEDLQPLSKGPHNGDLLPTKGAEEEAVNADLQPHLHDGQDEEEADLNLHVAPIDGHNQEEGALLPTNGDDDDTNNEALQPLPKGSDKGFLLPQQSEDGDNHHAIILDLSSSLKDGQHEDDNSSLPPFIGAEDQQNNSDSVPAINAWVLPSPRPRVKMKNELPLYDVHAWEHDAWAYTSSPSPISILIILFKAKLHAKLPDRTIPFTPLRGRRRYQGHETHMFMKKSKPKIRNITMKMRLLYNTKDILDPG